MTRKSFFTSLFTLGSTSVAYGTTTPTWCKPCNCNSQPCACKPTEVPIINPFDVDLSPGVLMKFTPVTDSNEKPYLLALTDYDRGYAALINAETGLAQIEKLEHPFDFVIAWPRNIKSFGWILNGGIWVRDWNSSLAWTKMPGFSR